MGGEFTYQPKWDPIGFDNHLPQIFCAPCGLGLRALEERGVVCRAGNEEGKELEEEEVDQPLDPRPDGTPWPTFPQPVEGSYQPVLGCPISDPPLKVSHS